ncbi:MAG: antitoxin [Pseudomonadota bacterium]
MKAITIRGIDPVVSLKLKQAADRENKSVNQFVLEIIKEHIGLQKVKKYTRRYDDMDSLFGSWSEEEFQAVQDKITGQRKIDQELWE